jgi:hypothetical protein
MLLASSLYELLKSQNGYTSILSMQGGSADLSQRLAHLSLFSLRAIAMSQLNFREVQKSELMIGSLKTAFSCIILFQTGHINIDPESLGGTMAISHGDSIFVAQRILLDPSENDIGCPVRRIVGNVGKAGLVILVPPRTPEMREQALSDWGVVNHTPFDGKYENNFVSTSLHLAFTGYELPIDVREHGSLNHEAFFVETVISVYEGGEWVADLDILKALSDYQHGWPENVKSKKKKIRTPLVSVDNWHEILDNPEGNAIVRACGNKQARLAIATVASQLGYSFRIISPDDHLDYEPERFRSPKPDQSLSARGSVSKNADLHNPDVLKAMADYNPLDIDHDEESELESDQSLDITDMSPHPDEGESDHLSAAPDSPSISDSGDDVSLVKGVLFIC